MFIISHFYVKGANSFHIKMTDCLIVTLGIKYLPQGFCRKKSLSSASVSHGSLQSIYFKAAITIKSQTDKYMVENIFAIENIKAAQVARECRQGLWLSRSSIQFIYMAQNQNNSHLNVFYFVR